MNKSIRTTRPLVVVLALAFAIAPLAEAGQAEPRYHLITFADVGPASAITDSGVILAGNKVVKPARDAAGNPIWDSDGDRIADGYAVSTLDAGPGEEVYPQAINEALDVVGYIWVAGWRRAALWRRGPDGAYTLVDLGSAFTAAQKAAFENYDVGALDINDRGQVLVSEAGEDWALYNPDDPHPPSDSIGALVVITPKDIDADGDPDTWFEDANGDGVNDLMAPVEFHAVSDPWDMNQWHGTGRINNHGQVVAMSFVPGRGIFVVLPKDTSNGMVWFEDLDPEDGSNDLATDLGLKTASIGISDSGAIVGAQNQTGLSRLYRRWQIDGDGTIALVATEDGECDMYGVNNQGDAVAYLTKHGDAILWEADGTIIEFLALLDNPRDAGKGMCARDISNTDFIVGESNGKAFVAVPLAQAPPPATPGITVEPTDGLITTEDPVAPGTDTFTIVLDTQPAADVTIGLSSSDTTEGTVSPASVTFTAADWDQPQTVTVTGVDDAEEDGDIDYSIATAAAVSADPDYNGLDAADVAVFNLDNEAQPQPTEVRVDTVIYTPVGPKDLNITVVLLDDFGDPVAGASVSVDVTLEASLYTSATGATGDDGTVVFKLKKAPSGTYSTEVTDVVAAGLTWVDGTPTNSYTK